MGIVVGNNRRTQAIGEGAIVRGLSDYQILLVM